MGGDLLVSGGVQVSPDKLRSRLFGVKPRSEADYEYPLDCKTIKSINPDNVKKKIIF